MSQVRQNFHPDCENAINKQINLELCASYVYLSMAYHFDRNDVALKGMHVIFKKRSNEKRKHAEKLMKYLNKRGGRVILPDIAKPSKDAWKSPKESVSDALLLDRDVHASLLHVCRVACDHKDSNLREFLKTAYQQELADSFKAVGDFRRNLSRVGEGFGTYILDNELNKLSIQHYR